MRILTFILALITLALSLRIASLVSDTRLLKRQIKEATRQLSALKQEQEALAGYKSEASSGVIAQGAMALISSAAGTRINLFKAEPLATAHTTGSSRAADTPDTCWALSARSSPSTPAVFLAATLVITETSSRTVAMSSSNRKRLLAIRVPYFGKRQE